MNNPNSTKPQNKAVPADYAKVQIIDENAVLKVIAQFSLKGEWLNPMNPEQPYLSYYSDAQFDYFKSTNVSMPTCLKALQTKYNKIKRRCLELKIYDNRPEINYAENDRCIVWWLDGVEVKNMLNSDWFEKYYYPYYKNRLNKYAYPQR
jgi:hypothetical protein